MFCFVRTSSAFFRCSFFKYDWLLLIRLHIFHACFLERRIAKRSCMSSTNLRSVPSVGDRLRSSSNIARSYVLIFDCLVKVEVTLHGFLNCGRIELIDQDTIKYGLPYLVVVLRLLLHIFWVRMKRFTTLAFGDILAVTNFSPKLLLKCYRTNQTNTNPFASTKCSTSWTRCLSRMTRINYRFSGCFVASMPGSFF